MEDDHIVFSDPYRQDIGDSEAIARRDSVFESAVEPNAFNNEVVSDISGGDRVEIVKSLNTLAGSPELVKSLSGEDGRISKTNLDTAIMVDDVARSRSMPFDRQSFLTSKERQAVVTLQDNWNKLKLGNDDQVDLSGFTDSKLEQIQTSNGAGVADDKPGPESRKYFPETPSATPSKVTFDANPPATTGEPSEAAATRALESLHARQIAPQGPFAQSRSMLLPTELREAGEAVFARVDRDGDGFLSRAELGGALRDRSYTGQESQAIAALYNRGDEIQKLSNDEWGWERSGVSRADLESFDRIAHEQAGSGAAAGYGLQSFGKLDSNGDGVISRQELKSASDPSRVNDLQHLVQHFDRIKDSHRDFRILGESGITRADLEAYQRSWNGDWSNERSDDSKLVSKVGSDTYSVSRSQSRTNPSLYGDGVSPLDSIKPSAVHQGNTGNCWFESSLASLASTNPEAIRNMITDNKDGTYTVTFPGDPSRPVTVDAPTDGEIGLFDQAFDNSGRYNGYWSTVMEKAFGRYQQLHNGGKGETDTEGAGMGGNPKEALRLLTGRDYQTSSIPSGQVEASMMLREALASGQPLVAITDRSLFSDTTSDDFARNHAYSILGFQPGPNGGGTVEIRNPWGGSDNTTRGSIRISLEQFMRNFSQVSRPKAK